jgi:hypothetical protein
MTFSDRLFAGEFPVALEITPPQRPRPAVLLRRARLLDDRAAAINVIQRPDRQPSFSRRSLSGKGWRRCGTWWRGG